MSTPAPERRPQVFAADDPAIIEDAQPADLRDGDRAEAAMPAQPLSRPTLYELGQRGLRWGTLLVSALAGAAFLGACAWFARLVSAALTRDDWIGWAVLGLLLVAAFATLMMLLRELIGFARLARLNRLRGDIDKAITDKNAKRERMAAMRLAALYARRPELRWSVRRFREHARDVHDAGELLALAEREIMQPLDGQARGVITRAAKRVATVTALSPLALIAVSYVLIENLRLLRALAALYGGRPGFIGLLGLARMVFIHLIATGGVALTDDLLGQFLGQDILRRLSRRLGEGTFNGALTARIGVAAIHVIRPLPFLCTHPPRVRDVLGEVLKPMLRAGRKDAK
jgi:putative membrane protein